jgi:NAD(P)-dependent dehydrogenase (short-subunit alcohol dehydrogenase family)
MDIGIQMEGSIGKLAHKVAVVTGASKAIGAEVTRDLAAVERPLQSIYVGRRNGLNGRIADRRVVAGSGMATTERLPTHNCRLSNILLRHGSTQTSRMVFI